MNFKIRTDEDSEHGIPAQHLTVGPIDMSRMTKQEIDDAVTNMREELRALFWRIWGCPVHVQVANDEADGSGWCFKAGQACELKGKAAQGKSMSGSLLRRLPSKNGGNGHGHGK